MEDSDQLDKQHLDDQSDEHRLAKSPAGAVIREIDLIFQLPLVQPATYVDNKSAYLYFAAKSVIPKKIQRKKYTHTKIREILE